MKRRAILQAGAGLLLSPLAMRSWAADGASSADLAGDIDILREALKLHPGLYRYQSPLQTAVAIGTLRETFARAPTSAARYLLLSRFLASICCGHSYASFFNQKKAVAADLFDRPTRLPLRFVWSGDAMIVVDEPTGRIAPGSEIIRIGGRSPIAMRRAMMPYVRADGHNDAKRLALLEVRGEEPIETFDVFQGLMFPPPAGGVHQVEVRDPGGAIRSFELPAIGLAARRKDNRAVDAPADGAIWDWSMRGDGLAVLTMPSWALYDSKWDWRSWLDQRLDALDGASGLIIDVRANEGGQDCGDAILARLIRKDYAPPRIEQRLRFQRTPAALDPFLDTWDDSFRTLGVGAKPLGNGFFLRPGGDSAMTITASAKRLRVPVAVLIGPVNSSATFNFAQNVRQIGGARLYGQTSGGNLRGINGGCFFFVRLPASGLEFDLPLIGYFPLKPQPDAGLAPDVAITVRPADIAARRDPVLARAAADLLRA